MSELLRELYFGLTNDHIVKDPISRSCGHIICKQCIPEQVKIKCKICSIETESPSINLSELFEELEKRRMRSILLKVRSIHLMFIKINI